MWLNLREGDEGRAQTFGGGGRLSVPALTPTAANTSTVNEAWGGISWLDFR